jgi:hypothetical protein
MNAQCIKKSTRPNLHKLKENDLLKIINHYDKTWYNAYNNVSRDDMVVKVFDLWSNYELSDCNAKPIECLICWDDYLLF